VSTLRWLILAALLVFVVIVGVHAVTPWKWSGQTAAPVPQSVYFRCGAPWGAAYVHGPTTTAYPLVATPCGQRSDLRVLSGVDLLLGALGLIAVATWGREWTRFRTVG
jgi:hypothetical protein